MTTAEISSLIDMLRSKGAVSFSMGDLRIELGAIEAPPDKGIALDPDACACGHAAFQHVNGLCTVGCDVAACAPEEKK